MMNESNRSQLLNISIDQTYPQLPWLLGEDFPSFRIQLERLRWEGSDQELLNLFKPYPIAYRRLLTNLLLLAAFRNSFNDKIFTSVATTFRCPEGPHEVEAKNVKDRNVDGNALCPDHKKPMTPVGQP